MPGPSVPEDLVELGRISGAYGIKGWVRVRAYSPDSSTLLDTKQWWLEPPVPKTGAGGFTSARLVKVVASRIHSDTIVARFADITDRTQAEALKGCSVWVSRADFPTLDADEYYWVDLVGCRLYGVDDGRQVLIGQVVGMMDNGAHGVLRVTRATDPGNGELVYDLDAKGRQREALVPFVASHVHTVDLANKLLLSNWPIDA